MRITQNNFYNRFVAEQQGIKQQLDALSRQISSGTKIKYGYEDPAVFADTLRLDYEEHSLTQAVSVATDAQNFADNTDSVMFQFSDALTRFKTLLIQAANGSNAESNYYAISNELKSLKEHLVNLGNSSINGRFLFSGSKLDVKPLDKNGHYHGNGEELKAVVGAGVEVPYNIPGEDLFLGEDANVHRVVTTNIPLLKANGNDPVTLDTTLQEVTGNANSFTFTVQGRKSDGTIVSSSFSLNPAQTVKDLLDKIAEQYSNDTVDVGLVNGYIHVRDKLKGNSLFDFHIYGTDGTEDIDFIKTPGTASGTYDGVPFEKTGEYTFRGNMGQFLLSNGSVAKGSNRLQETTAVDLSGGRTLNIAINGTDPAAAFGIDETTSYQQLIDELKSQVSAVTGNDAAVWIDRNGKLNIQSEGLDSFALYDANAPSLLFNTNDALTVDDPKHDLFASLGEAIEAVENGLLYPDGSNDALARNPGIENALERIDHVLDHVEKEHTKIGAMSNSLKYAVERSETLRINVQTLRSDVLDTDIGEATVRLNQLSLNFQAMMASIAKVQNLSLVNYI
ncbi:flagellar hook-associated protein FlgL [Hydrogenimonas urashimensis]|uniref:flagellar hook-associated protein FlgL n=1 Tax=Hydrogenimonas urashimensis TaxID=2740515 RepID=UPI001916B339|nr:flagellar hook-associated protein FlgL [Hydrogenimonas urashimensis]